MIKYLLGSIVLASCGSHVLRDTGQYQVVAFLDYDDCVDPSMADSDFELDFGTWLISKTEGYSYFADEAGIQMVAEDGEHFSTFKEGNTFSCGHETWLLEADLVIRGTLLDGVMRQYQTFTDCWSLGTGHVDFRECNRQWSLDGARQELEGS